jgi:hypothetical protein
MTLFSSASDQRLDQLFWRIGSGVNEFSQFLEKGSLVFALEPGGPGVRVGHDDREVQDMP